MTNLSRENFISFLVLSLLPSGLRSSKEKGGTGTKQDSVGPSQVQKHLCISHFLFFLPKASVSEAFTEFQRADSSS